MERIQHLLDAAWEPNSKNRLTLDDVKAWLAEYLEMRSEEISRFPNQKDTSHWDLLAADYDLSKDAHFIAACFSGNQVTFLAGRGSIPDVREFAQSAFPENPDEVLNELARRFTTGGQWSSPADSIINWA